MKCRLKRDWLVFLELPGFDIFLRGSNEHLWTAFYRDRCNVRAVRCYTKQHFAGDVSYLCGSRIERHARAAYNRQGILSLRSSACGESECNENECKTSTIEKVTERHRVPPPALLILPAAGLE